MSKFASLGLAVEKPVRMTITNPLTHQPLRDKKGSEAWIELLSMDSPQAQAHGHKITNQKLRQRGRSTVSSEELEADRVELLAALTRGWRLLGLDGVAIDIDCNADTTRQLYTEPSMFWLREQVNEFIADRANFLPASSKN